jgi:hypothetical protein
MLAGMARFVGRTYGARHDRMRPKGGCDPME